MAAAHAAHAHKRPLPPHFGQTVAGIFIFISALGLAAAYGLQAMAERAREVAPPPPGEPIHFTLAAVDVAVPLNWLRSAPSGGFVEAIELSVPIELAGAPEPMIADVTLLARARAVPSAALLDRLYIHRFSDQQVSGPHGLIGKPLIAEAGYENETVWYDPVNGNPFVAKCLELIDEGQRVLECMRTIPLGTKVSAVVRFDEPALMRWQEFDAAVTAALQEMI
jgi:hypothetical protein